MLVAVTGLALSQPKVPISPDKAELLAEGPIPVSVVVKQKRTGERTRDKGVLFFLTREGLYYKEAKTGKVLVLRAKDLAEASVETDEPVARAGGSKKQVFWQLDKAGDAFAGEKLPLAAPNLAPLPGDKPEELNWFLYHALVHLQERVNAAINASDDLQLAFYAQHASELDAFATRYKLDKEVAKAFGSLPDYIKSQVDTLKELETVYVEQLKRRQELIQKAREAEALRRSRQLLGGLQALGGALSSSYEYREVNGRLYRVESGPDLDNVFGGLQGVYQAQADYQHQMSQLRVANEAFEDRAKKLYTELSEKFKDGRAGRETELRTIAVTRYGLAKEHPFDRFPKAKEEAEKTKSVEPLIALFVDRVKYDRGTGNWNNPFALCELYDTLAIIVPKDAKRSSELFALAQKALEAVRFVPPGEVFAYERMEVLRHATRLLCNAARADARDGFWAKAFNPRAAYAVRLIDRIDGLARLDVTGDLREQRAVALLLVGQLPEALEQALAIGKLRETNGTYHYTLARLHSAQYWALDLPKLDNKSRFQFGDKYGKQALESVKAAFQLGFSELRELKEGGYDSDFYAMLTSPGCKDSARDLLRPKIRSKMIPHLTAQKATVTIQITNDSPFKLTNVTGHFEYVTAKEAKKPPLEPAINVIRPGRDGQFEIDLTGAKPNSNKYTIRLKFDQGEYVYNGVYGKK
jgi:hypothetical protein